VIKFVDTLLLSEILPNFLLGALWDEDELVRFQGQQVKGQGHGIPIDGSQSKTV